MISIHVPARGTTLITAIFMWSLLFQSTSPRGGRRQENTLNPAGNWISIHVPARGTTQNRDMDCLGVQISIHVPARGTTRGIRWRCLIRSISIHVPARGTTFRCAVTIVDGVDFNPRPREGDDHDINQDIAKHYDFNPRPREGDDGISN